MSALHPSWPNIGGASCWLARLEDRHRLAGESCAFSRSRSFLPIACFEPLARLTGVRLISLQKHAGREQIAEFAARFPIIDLGDRLDETSGAYFDTPAAMLSLDLVITPDSSLAHAAGALGVPVWLALPYVPEFRWLLDREDSPWYPTMRLFRQTSPGDWPGVFGAWLRK